MYEIDFNTCSLDDVIERSVTCHPTLLVELLRAIAEIHSRSAREMFDQVARKSAVGMAEDCRRAANSVETLGSLVGASFGMRMQAFTAACKLQLLPLSLAQDIAKRDDAARAKATDI